MTTTTRNEAAERLRTFLEGHAPWTDHIIGSLDEALAAEFERGAMSGVNATHKTEVEIRRATVERIRAPLMDLWLNEFDEVELSRVIAILDAEAAR